MRSFAVFTVLAGLLPSITLPSGLSAASLRESALACGISYGCCVGGAFPGDATYTALIARECNIAVAENAMKFAAIEPQQNQFNWQTADALLAFCQQHGMKLRGHCLVWHVGMPSWLTGGNFNRQQMLDIMKNHIYQEVGRYKGNVVEWDVVNEAIDDRTYGLRSSVWKDRIGDDYLDSAFVFAHRADPAAVLYYNDYGGEGSGGKSDGIYNLVAGMRQRGIPVHGVGLQCHFAISIAYSSIDANIKRLGALGLMVSITELDIIIPIPPHDATMQQQGSSYKQLMQVFLANRPVCTNFLTWGITDKYSWLNGGDMFGAPLPFDANYQPKPAYDSLLCAMNLADVVALPVISPNGGSFTDQVTVSLSCATAGATIYYTTDGSTPTTLSTLYASPFTLTASATVKTIGVKGGLATSGTASAVFTKLDGSVPYRVNCGGGAVSPFTADAEYNGGTAYPRTSTITTSGVANAAPMAVYQTERYGNMTYTFTGLSAGAGYTVRLHFAELNWTAAGQRSFNVSINSQQVLGQLDIFAAAGGANKALVRDFPVTATGGQIVLQFTTITDNAQCCGIEILKNTGIKAFTGSRPPVPGMGGFPNPVTRAQLCRLLQSGEAMVYSLSGAAVEAGGIRANGVYLIAVEGQAASKIMVVE